MSATGYTPISLYYSTTASAAPTAGNLTNGELAINITDGKLYYKTNTNGIASLGGSTNLTQIDRQSYTASANQTTFSITYGLPLATSNSLVSGIISTLSVDLPCAMRKFFVMLCVWQGGLAAITSKVSIKFLSLSTSMASAWINSNG